MASKKEVEAFLKELKVKISIFDIAFRPRSKNLQSLADLDIMPKDRIDYLKKLTYKNYYTGPNSDTFNPDQPDYFEFGMDIKGFEVYIKISLGLTGKMVDCMSFHIAEKSIEYPLKNDQS